MSTPGSATYHHFLSPRQYRSRYAPTATELRAVRTYFTRAGLTAHPSGSDRDYIALSGTATRFERSFDTELRYYQRDGRRVQAPARALSLPRSVGTSVLSVTGLDTTPHRLRPLDQPAGTRTASPCSSYFGQVAATAKADGSPLPPFKGKVLPYAVCGYTGTQYRSAYEANSRLTGAGVTVAVLGAYASPTIASDANTYAVKHGDNAYRTGQLTQRLPSRFDDPLGDCGDPTDYYGEESLDVEAVHAMARDANVRYYGTSSCEDQPFLDTYRRVLDENTAQIVSTSYGEPEGDVPLQELPIATLLFARGALQGVSFLFSSGDFGDELVERPDAEVSFEASDPLVTAVGGTSTAIGASGALDQQTGWGTHTYTESQDGTGWDDQGFTYGAGGGRSRYFLKPTYQAAAVGGSRRAVPDVAMDADPATGMLVGETQTFPDGTYYDEFRLGGTSLACPLFAGMTALAIQAAGHRVGLLNPIIYAKRSAFTDVLPSPRNPGVVRADYSNGIDASGGIDYSVRSFDEDSSLRTTPGYDLVTGLGTPNPGWLNALR